MSIRIPGVHYEGPILGDNRTRGPGFLHNVAHSALGSVGSPYKVWYEDFPEQAADAQLATQGWTVTAINTPTAASEVVTGAQRYLLLNPGSKADSGSEIQFDIPGTAASVSNVHNVIPEIVSTAALMDGQEIFWEARVGLQSDLVAHDMHFCIGWIVKDAALMTNTTGALDIAAGGGFGFHIDGDTGDGSLDYFSSPDAVTTATDAGLTSFAAVDAVNTFKWHVFGAKMRCIDASGSTGVTDFFYNGRNVGSINNSTCMDSTETFSFSIGYHNGPAQVMDVGVDYILSGITKPGLTWPYDGTTDIF